jgi:RNA polymerase sporulation-specific sigma factor
MFDGFFYLINNVFLLTSSVDNQSSFPQPLTESEEKKYLDLYSKGDINARDILVHHNMRLVVHIAKKYSNYPDSDELLSVGSIGLIKAIKTYIPGKGTQLATYAARCIENEILMVLRVNKKHKNNISIYEPIGVDKDGNEMTFMDLLSTDENDIIDNIEQEALKTKLMSIIKDILTRREFEIIKLRSGLYNDIALTQREVAQIINISRSYVSRIESKALSKIKAYLSKEGFSYS